MFGLFKKKKVDNNIYAPVDGKSIALDCVPDKIFASKMLGDGIAFEFGGNKIYSPCYGTITTIADTKHAFGIKMENGMEILVHVGLDTVNLNGHGFHVFKKVNDKVKPGDMILELDLSYMRENNINLITPLVVANDNGCQYKIAESGQSVKAGCDGIIMIS